MTKGNMSQMLLVGGLLVMVLTETGNGEDRRPSSGWSTERKLIMVLIFYGWNLSFLNEMENGGSMIIRQFVIGYFKVLQS